MYWKLMGMDENNNAYEPKFGPICVMANSKSMAEKIFKILMRNNVIPAMQVYFVEEGTVEECEEFINILANN